MKKRLAHSSAEHEAPSPEVNVPSDASRHPAVAVQHEHWQSSSPQGDGGGGGQATGSKWALTLPGEFEFDGAAISPGDGHLRIVTYSMLAAAMLQGHCSPRPCRSVWASVHSRVRPGPRTGRGKHSCVLPDPLRLLAPCGLYRQCTWQTATSKQRHCTTRLTRRKICSARSPSATPESPGIRRHRSMSIRSCQASRKRTAEETAAAAPRRRSLGP